METSEVEMSEPNSEGNVTITINRLKIMFDAKYFVATLDPKALTYNFNETLDFSSFLRNNNIYYEVLKELTIDSESLLFEIVVPDTVALEWKLLFEE